MSCDLKILATTDCSSNCGLNQSQSWAWLPPLILLTNQYNINCIILVGTLIQRNYLPAEIQLVRAELGLEDWFIQMLEHWPLHLFLGRPVEQETLLNAICDKKREIQTEYRIKEEISSGNGTVIRGVDFQSSCLVTLVMWCPQQRGPTSARRQ